MIRGEPTLEEINVMVSDAIQSGELFEIVPEEDSKEITSQLNLQHQQNKEAVDKLYQTLFDTQLNILSEKKLPHCSKKQIKTKKTTKK